MFGDLGPLVAVDPVQPQNIVVLLRCPRGLFDGRVQVVVPPLSALFTDAPLQLGGDH